MRNKKSAIGYRTFLFYLGYGSFHDAENIRGYEANLVMGQYAAGHLRVTRDVDRRLLGGIAESLASGSGAGKLRVGTRVCRVAAPADDYLACGVSIGR